jgi:uncharacterized coiled-coil DUF342 family protein
MDLNELLHKYAVLREEIAAKEKQRDRYRSKILQYMRSRGQTSKQTADYRVSCVETKSERIAKENVPKDVWERYATASDATRVVVRRLK